MSAGRIDVRIGRLVVADGALPPGVTAAQLSADLAVAFEQRLADNRVPPLTLAERIAAGVLGHDQVGRNV